MTLDDIILSLIIGLASGFYASIVVSKIIAFCNARTQLLFAVKSIYFEAIGGKYVKLRFISLDTAALWHQELERLGHVKASNTAYDIIKEAKKICKRIQDAASCPNARVPYTPEEMFSFLRKWEKQVTELSPNFCIVISPTLKL